MPTMPENRHENCRQINRTTLVANVILALDNIISATPRTDKLILLGDFNVRVGTDHQTWEGRIGSEGVGKCNSNGIQLLRKCAEHDLLITDTVFKLPNLNKTSWMHPRSKHWHLIDFVIVRRTDIQDVRVTKVIEKQRTGTGAIKRQIPLLKPKREINKYYK